MMQNVIKVFSFGSFEFDPIKQHLIRDGAIIPLRSRSAAVLKVLLENAGQVVSRADLVALVWNDVSVSDGNLNLAIHQVRKALGDDPSNPTYVKTIARTGFVFLTPVFRIRTEDNSVGTMNSSIEVGSVA